MSSALARLLAGQIAALSNPLSENDLRSLALLTSPSILLDALDLVDKGSGALVYVSTLCSLTANVLSKNSVRSQSTEWHETLSSSRHLGRLLGDAEIACCLCRLLLAVFPGHSHSIVGVLSLPRLLLRRFQAGQSGHCSSIRSSLLRVGRDLDVSPYPALRWLDLTHTHTHSASTSSPSTSLYISQEHPTRHQEPSSRRKWASSGSPPSPPVSHRRRRCRSRGKGRVQGG